MNDIEYKIIPLTKENIKLLESLRYKAYNIDTSIIANNTNIHTKSLEEGKYLVFGCYLNNDLIGACYTSNNYNTLYIEQIFISPIYQQSKLHLGTKLLQFTLQNKEEAEKYFNTKFQFTTLEPSKNTSNFYKTIGYEEKSFYFRKKL